MTIETDFSQSFLPPDASTERRLDTVVNRRALMVYAARLIPELSPEDVAKAGLPVDSQEQFLEQQRERFTLAAIVREAHDGKQPPELLPTIWIPQAEAGWQRSSVEVPSMAYVRDEILDDTKTQTKIYEQVINQRVLQNIGFDPMEDQDKEHEMPAGPIHIEDMEPKELVAAFLQGALAMPGLDRSREVNVRRLVGVLNDHEIIPAKQAVA